MTDADSSIDTIILASDFILFFAGGPTLTYFLAALSSSRSIVVGWSLGRSVRWSVSPSTFVKMLSLDYQTVT